MGDGPVPEFQFTVDRAARCLDGARLASCLIEIATESTEINAIESNGSKWTHTTRGYHRPGLNPVSDICQAQRGRSWQSRFATEDFLRVKPSKRT